MDYLGPLRRANTYAYYAYYGYDVDRQESGEEGHGKVTKSYTRLTLNYSHKASKTQVIFCDASIKGRRMSHPD